MSERAPRFDEDEFRKAIEESFDVSSVSENDIGVPPESDDESSGQDEVPDIM
jgi:hypothetical protein